ncbi:MAG: hypothetical protein FJ011_27140 [Chloroflexi bacterium]|nr:hypothetical protein [Chloroflexota bacterium]
MATSTKTRKATVKETALRGPSAPAVFLCGLLLVLAVGLAIGLDALEVSDGVILAITIPLLLIGVYILLALQVGRQWEKAVVLRLGKFQALRGPGLFWIVPVMDTITEWIDHRVMVTPFNAEKTLTKDTVPTDVD